MDSTVNSTLHVHCPNKPENFTPFMERKGGYTEMYEIYTIRIILDRIIRPIWFLLGIPGTLISFFVWTRPRMRQSSGVYLASLALVDFVFFVCQIPFFLTTSWHIPTIGYPVICELYCSLNMFLQYMSPLLILAFTAQRYLAICHPYASDRLCTTSRAVKITLALTLVAGAIASPQGYFFQYQANRKFECDRRPEVMDEHNWQSSFYSYWDLVTELCIFGLIPIIILVLNICVIHETRRLSRRLPGGIQAQPLHKTGTAPTAIKDGGSSTSGQTGPTASATTFMLLCVSFYLICATLPVTISQLLLHRFWIGDECLTDKEIVQDSAWQQHFVFMNIRAVVEALAFSHYVAKFYIYLATGKQFRRECLRLLHKCFPTKLDR